ncbi:PaaI family thioesterase [Sciscionella marina]|uniref:PaaI family thioesterase n=1 Tax=Sciscionella marina TaxID=508770 RepID=UPI00047786E2|nr:hotdog fold thioesterase [Sciscionella marina]
MSSTVPGAPATAVELLNSRSGEMSERLGIVVVEASAERIVATMPVEGNRQAYGFLHGGASVTLAETVGSALAVLATDFAKTAVGVEINATHHRSATRGLVTATATVLAMNRMVATVGITVTDQDGAPVCTSRLSCLLRDRQRPGSGH